MDLKLNGRRTLVTGSSSGIGVTIASMLAAEGAKVVVHGRDAARAGRVADGIATAGGTVATALGDLATTEGVAAVVDGAVAAFGGIDILVNNAGVSSTSHDSWFDIEPDRWLEMYTGNTLSAIRLAQALVPGMRDRGWGRVIQISSRNAISPYPQFADYGAAKAALNNVTLGLAKALAGTGVTSNGIMPGMIHTPMLDPWFMQLAHEQGSEDPAVGRAYAIEHVLRQTVGRLGAPADIAAAVCFVASPLADFMSGTTFRIDGGATPTV